MHQFLTVLHAVTVRRKISAFWLGTSLLSCDVLAMSERDFVSLVNSSIPEVERQFGLYSIDSQIRPVAARYYMVKSFMIINQKFSQLGCDPLLDYASRTRIWRDSTTEAMQWSPKYADYYRGELLKFGADVAMFDYGVQRAYSQLRCK